MTYYRVDTSRLTYAECWRIAGFGFPILAGMKLLGVGLPMDHAVAGAQSLVPIEEEDLPPAARRRMRDLLEPLLGSFEPAFLYEGQQLQKGEGFGRVFHSPDRRVVGQVLYSRVPPQEACVLGFMSRLEDGTLVLTVAKKREWETPPGMRMRFLPGAAPAELARAHHAHLAEACRRSPVVACDPAELVLENERRSIEFNVRRGVYRPMAEEEVQALRRRLAEASAMGS